MVVGNHPRSHGRLWFGTRDLIKNLLLVTALTVMLLHEGYLLFNAGKHGAFPTARDLSFETPYPSGNPEEAIADELWLPQLGPLQSTNTMEEDQDAETKKEEEEQEATLLLEERPLLKDIPREIALIHVGKAGGMTLRTSTALHCGLVYGKNQTQVNECIEKHFNPVDNKLSYQTRIYCHIFDCNETLFENSTSFLIPLRNPVDRVISTYRYSHPSNCNEKNNKTSTRPKGCHNAKDIEKNTKSSAYKVFAHCFPSPGVEEFAQAAISPWAPMANLTVEEQWQCRKLARDMLQKKAKEMSGLSLAAPHLHYNYEYYASKSIWKYPDKEVFGIRTEHEWEDMVELDKRMGGTGNFSNEGKSISHGSEKYHPSPVSTEAYQKLCCVLEQEIEIYMDIMDRVDNLNEEQKQEGIEKLRVKCQVDVSWAKWRNGCRKRLEEDRKQLEVYAKVAAAKAKNTTAKKIDRRALLSTSRLADHEKRG